MDVNRKKIRQSMVVLGGGFLGKNIVSFLEKSDYDVRMIDRNTCDFLDYNQVLNSLNSVPEHATLYITAAVTRLSSNDRISFEQNIRIVQNILDALPPLTRHIVFFSTIDVYGLEPLLPINEATATAPNDYYSMSKLVGEFLLEKETSSRGIGLTVFRLCGIYGEGDTGKSTINRMVSSVLNRGEIILTGNPLIERDFIWAQDVAWLGEVASKENISGIYNVATGHSLTISGICSLVVEFSGQDISILRRQNTGQSTRALRLQFDTTKLKKNFRNITLAPLEGRLLEYFAILRRALK